jgi:hypothetical protein
MTKYKEFSAKLGNRSSRKLANNTYLERRNERTLAIRLHATDVVTITPNYIELDSGGWHTPITKDRMQIIGVSIGSLGKRGWSVFPMMLVDCYCVTDGHPNKRFALNPETNEWDYSQDGCYGCSGTLKVRRADWESEGYVYFDGIRLSADASQLAKSQPNRPDGFYPVVTRSGWSGMTRRESRQSWTKQMNALTSGDYDTFYREREKRAGHVATLAPERIEETPLGTAAVYSMSHDMIHTCPYCIFSPEHYRADGSCRCDDPTHRKMHEWGYRWDGERWNA